MLDVPSERLYLFHSPNPKHLVPLNHLEFGISATDLSQPIRPVWAADRAQYSGFSRIGVIFSLFNLPVQWYSSALAGHLTWTLPFAFLIMLGIFGRFNPAYEEAARDMGASDSTTFWRIVFPLIASSVIGVGLLGFTLSYDEFTRTSLILAKQIRCRWKSLA